MSADAILARWKVNAAAANVPLSEEDIERIQRRGFLERVVAVELMIDRLAKGEVMPDYLEVLAVSTGEAKHD